MPLPLLLSDARYAVIVDPARLRAIADLGLDSRAADAELADAELAGAVRAAAQIVGLPTALVSVVLEGSPRRPAVDGQPEPPRGAPMEWSLCRHVVQGRAPVVITEAVLDVGAPGDEPTMHVLGVRAYASVPLTTSDGHVVGTLCVLGSQPRGFTTTQILVLRAIAGRVIRQLGL